MRARTERRMASGSRAASMGCIACNEGAVCEAIVSSTIYNVENRRSALPGFLVNAINDLSFQRFFKIQAVPSSVIRKCATVVLCFSLKNSALTIFPLLSEHKDRVGQGLYMFQIDIG